MWNLSLRNFKGSWLYSIVRKFHLRSKLPFRLRLFALVVSWELSMNSMTTEWKFNFAASDDKLNFQVNLKLFSSFENWWTKSFKTLEILQIRVIKTWRYFALLYSEIELSTYRVSYIKQDYSEKIQSILSQENAISICYISLRIFATTRNKQSRKGCEA